MSSGHRAIQKSKTGQAEVGLRHWPGCDPRLRELKSLSNNNSSPIRLLNNESDGMYQRFNPKQKQFLKGRLKFWNELYQGKIFDMGKKAQWRKALAPKSDNLSLMSGAT